MVLTGRNVFLILLMLCIALSPVLAGNFGLDEDDHLDDDGLLAISALPVTWTRMLVHQVSVLLRLGISIFALYLVYLGGRSKNKRFNDRTIEPIKSLKVVFLKTALLEPSLISSTLTQAGFYKGSFDRVFCTQRFYIQGGRKS